MSTSTLPGVANGTARGLAIKGMDANVAALIKQMVLKPSNREATDAELAMFAEQCQRTGLDPFTGQIYGIFRYDKHAGGEVLKVQVSIDGLRLIAERTGKYQGQTPVYWCGTDERWTDVWLKDEHPAAAKAGVYKDGHREPTWAVATWKQYAQTDRSGKLTGLWPTMGPLMLGKCAEALALRKCFPNEMSGLHTAEELDEAAPTLARATVEPSGGMVDITATAPALTADGPKATVPAATAEQRRMVMAKARDKGMTQAQLKDLLAHVAGSPLIDRMPKDAVDQVLEAIADWAPIANAEVTS